MDGVNRLLDAMARTRLGRGDREIPAFRTCGVVGFYLAVAATLAGGLLAGRSLLILAVLSVVAACSFLLYVYVRKWLTGRETMVLLDQVWLAELCMAAALWAMREPVLPYMDPVSVGLCFFLAAGRVGCLLVGCCHGQPAAFGITYGEEHAKDGFPPHLVGVRLFPVQAVEAIGLALIGVSGLAALPFAAPGRVFLWFLLAYAVMRFGLEGLRGDERPHFLGLSKARWMSLVEIGFVLFVTTGGWNGVSPRDAVLFAVLASTLVAALAARRYFDPRPALLGDDHLAELVDLVSSEIAKTAGNGHAAVGLPEVRRTSRGVGVAVSRMSANGSDALHLSLSLPGGLRDVALLCRLAVACPVGSTGSFVLGGAGVLHWQIESGARRAITADPRATAARLYGDLVRNMQAEDPTSAPNGRAPPRDAYFGASERWGELASSGVEAATVHYGP